jgi:triosephosphate isomerase
MNGTPGGAAAYLEKIAGLLPPGPDPEVVVFPPFTLLSAMAPGARKAGIMLGGQDLFWEDRGAFTGEISPGMLVDAGCTWFLAGHSERRHVTGEDDATVRRKLEAGIASGLRGILCVGELLEEREAGKTEETVRRQLEAGILGLDAGPGSMAVAYEPVWAIGTGLTATPGEAQRVHSLIRGWVEEARGAGFADALRIIYGGSVKPDNAGAIMEGPDVDGTLVGGASLDAGDFARIVAASGG